MCFWSSRGHLGWFSAHVGASRRPSWAVLGDLGLIFDWTSKGFAFNRVAFRFSDLKLLWPCARKVSLYIFKSLAYCCVAFGCSGITPPTKLQKTKTLQLDDLLFLGFIYEFVYSQRKAETENQLGVSLSCPGYMNLYSPGENQKPKSNFMIDFLAPGV